MDDLLSERSLEEWRRAANYRSAQKYLSASWLGAGVFGLLSVWMGYSSFASDWRNAFLVVLGIFLLFTSILSKFGQRSWAMVLGAFGGCCVGLWNISLLPLSFPSDGGPPSEIAGKFFVLGIVQIAWACRELWLYWERRFLPSEAPTPEFMQRLTEVVEDVIQSDVTKHDDMVQFETTTFSGTQVWKGRLGRGAAVFVEGRGEDIAFCGCGDVAVRDNGRGLLSKHRNARFTLGTRKRTGTIAPEHLARLNAWRVSVEPGGASRSV